ncbi:MAG: HD domain-containing protein [Chloroflexota bacterium]
MRPEAILRFLDIAWELKRVRRQGWVDRGMDDPESTADHSWGVALLAWMLAGERDDLDRGRVLLLGLVHDLPEALAGDATPFDSYRDASGMIPDDRLRNVPEYDQEGREQKSESEHAALKEMLRDVPASLAGEIREAWQEYDRASTAEARFVKQVDKLETLLQAELEKRRDPQVNIDSFRLGAERDVVDPDLQALVEVLLDAETGGDDSR